jgi:hypothetical protein
MLNESELSNKGWHPFGKVCKCPGNPRTYIKKNFELKIMWGRKPIEWRLKMSRQVVSSGYENTLMEVLSRYED